jgi:hypothetical protein
VFKEFSAELYDLFLKVNLREERMWKAIIKGKPYFVYIHSDLIKEFLGSINWGRYISGLIWWGLLAGIVSAIIGEGFWTGVISAAIFLFIFEIYKIL